MGESNASETNIRGSRLRIRPGLERVETLVANLSIRNGQPIRGPGGRCSKILPSLPRTATCRRLVLVRLPWTWRQAYRGVGRADDRLLLPVHSWNVGWILCQLASPCRILCLPRYPREILQISVQDQLHPYILLVCRVAIHTSVDLGPDDPPLDHFHD